MSLATDYPLVVDLDGTLIRTDLLHESALRVFRDKPLDALLVPYWLARGKAVLKRHLAERAVFDPSSFPYNTDLIEWLKTQRDHGRRLVLCTASDSRFADSISKYLGLFDEVIASDGETNLAGRKKAAALEQRFGPAGFDYVGNSRADLRVWQKARRAIVVNASTRLAEKARVYCPVEQIFPAHKLDFSTVAKILRLHQWLKNLLLFIPVFAAHRFADPTGWLMLLPAFFSFSLCASSVYIA
ncbi:MAG: haloacid dehalogenase-like hydrolase, partial [Gammaproteobacteria bacterium]